jgi:hypothetical protein
MYDKWGRRGMHVGYWWENLKERDRWDDQYLGVWIILKWIYNFVFIPTVFPFQFITNSFLPSYHLPVPG